MEYHCFQDNIKMEYHCFQDNIKMEYQKIIKTTRYSI